MGSNASEENIWASTRVLSEDMHHPAHVTRSLIRRYHGRGRWRAFRFKSPPSLVYSITSSARESSVGDTSRPSAFAVLRLITSSYLVGFCTGKSAGFSPLRMRSI
jgi:hypothetical protein